MIIGVLLLLIYYLVLQRGKMNTGIMLIMDAFELSRLVFLLYCFFVARTAEVVLSCVRDYSIASLKMAQPSCGDVNSDMFQSLKFRIL